MSITYNGPRDEPNPAKIISNFLKDVLSLEKTVELLHERIKTLEELLRNGHTDS